MAERTVLSIRVPNDDAPKAHISKGSDGRFFVAVRPCPDDLPSLEAFSGYIEARTHARALRRQRGCKIVNEVPAAIVFAAEKAEAARVEAKRWGNANGQSR